MRRKGTSERERNQEERMKPDCCVCIHRSGCERQAENSYCTRFQSREPERYEDPNEAWMRGDDVEF